MGGCARLDKVLDTMLGVQSGKIRPCDLWKVGEEFFVLIFCLGNGAEVECRDLARLHKVEKKNMFWHSQAIFPSGPLGVNWFAENRHLHVIGGRTPRQ